MRPDMITRSITLIVLCVAARLALGQNDVQYRLDTSSATSYVLKRSVITEDEGTLVLYSTPNGTALWKGDALGAPQWSVTLGSALDHDHELCALPDTGFILVEELSPDLIQNWVGDDTARYHIRFTRFSDQGTVIWSRMLSFDIVRWNMTFIGSSSSMTVTIANGNIYCCFASDPYEHPFLHVFELDLDGNLIWAKQYGTTYPGIIGSLWYDYSTGDDYGLHVDSTGAFYLAKKANFFPYFLANQVLRFAADGTPLWRNEYGYTNTGMQFSSDAMIGSQGDLFMIGAVLTIQSYGITMRILPTGELSRTDLYVLPYTNGFSRILHTSDVDAVLQAGSGYLHLNDIGDPQSTLTCTGTSNGEFTFSFSPLFPTYKNGDLSLPGILTTTHLIFGYVNHFPQVWRTNMDATDGCSFGTFNVTHYTVPDTIMDVIPYSVPGSQPLILNTTQGNLTTYPKVPLSTSEACSIFVGLPEHQAVGTFDLTVNSTVITRGNALQATVRERASMELLASDGKRYYGSGIQQPGTTNLPTNGLAPGVYLLKATSGAAGRVAMRRVIITD